MSERRRGRPPLADGAPSATMAVRMPVPLHDALVELAAEQRATVSDIVREVVRSHPRVRITFAKIVRRAGQA